MIVVIKQVTAMPKSSKTPSSVFSRRLKEARLNAGLSQKRLGIEAGMDEFVASTRINRYEKGVHQADETTASALARVLNVPLAYFYAEDNALAKMMILFFRLSPEEQETMLRLMQNMLN